MLSASCFNLEQSKILSYGNGLSNILASDDDNDIHPGSDKILHASIEKNCITGLTAFFSFSYNALEVIFHDPIESICR